MGGDAASFSDPTGAGINVPIALAYKQMRAEVEDGRERLYPVIRDIIEKPFEVWAFFGRNSVTGKVRLRRRYVKAFAAEGKGVSALGIVDTRDGHAVTISVHRKNDKEMGKQRQGRLIWGRESHDG
jgi:hypothetical protein